MKDYRSYIFAEGTDAERQQLQFLALKPSFSKAIEIVIAQYGLADRLREASKSGQKLNLLEFGSGEGLYLHQAAAVLEQHEVNLLASVNLYGVEGVAMAVGTADDYKLMSKPPRPYLRFYSHDLNRPLAECLGLKFDKANPQAGRIEFDFIYTVTILQHLADARTRLLDLYNSLKPGGIIYIRELVLSQGDGGWLPIHPFSDKLTSLLFAAVASRNNGLEVAKVQADWLREFEAEEITSQAVAVPIGGETLEGKYMMRQSLMAFSNLKNLFISTGAVSADEFESGWQSIYRDFSSKTIGRLVYHDTFARKPA